MKITVACVGRDRAGTYDGLFQDYVRRIPWPVTLKVVEERRALPPDQRRQREAELLRAALPDKALIVALDERGSAFDSATFAARLGRWRDDGQADLAFVIGGADGLDPSLRDAARLVLGLGPMTWPHMLVRVMLAEQLYRASTILSGHPYHRA